MNLVNIMHIIIMCGHNDMYGCMRIETTTGTEDKKNRDMNGIVG